MKKICVIGGGISGLSVLHYLKQKHAHRVDVEILLLEKNDYSGGTIRSVVQDGFIFESGANGFLASKPTTLQLAEQLNLNSDLVSADEQAKLRFLSVGNQLHQIPTDPLRFLSFKLFSVFDKLRIPFEYFVPKGNDPDETVYDFGKRRLGERFAKIFLDPMVSGIFGGDAKALNLRAAFPRIHEIEQTYGSLIKGALKLKRQKREKHYNVEPKGTLTSFQKGMSQFIDALYVKHKDHIQLNTEVMRIEKRDDKFNIKTTKAQFLADEVFLCVPAYAAANLLADFDKQLSEELAKILYAPMAVIGFVFKRADLGEVPKGFGYLIPSSENKKVLGVLFDSNIFPNRCGTEQFSLRAMIGGARYLDIFKNSNDEIVEMAREEIRQTLTISAKAVSTFYAAWPKAIPQYDQRYVQHKESIVNILRNHRNFHLVANYLDGVSLNDCIQSAKCAADQSDI